MKFPDGFVIKPDINVSGHENFLRLVREFSNPERKYDDTTIELGVPYANSDPKRFHNTEIVLKAKPGGGFEGTVIFKYNRLDLSTLHDTTKVMEISLVKPKGMFVVQHDPSDEICRRFGLIRDEVELSFDRCVEDGFSMCWVKAKRTSLVYCRSFLVYFWEYVATPTPSLPRRVSPLEVVN